MLKNINININKDDSSINNYLVCTSEFGYIPNVVSILNNYKIDTFTEYIIQVSLCNNISKEIISSGEDLIVNEKHFSKVGDGIYISYVVYDAKSDGLITDVIIYHDNKSSEKVDEIVSEIQKFAIGSDLDESNDKFNILSIDNNVLQIEPIDFMEGDYDNIDLYFNDEVNKKSKKLINKINTKNKGLTIIYGERGSGKSTLVNSLIMCVEKVCVFIPSNMIETVNTSEFKLFLRRYKNIVFIIDDCEMYLSNTYTKSNLFANSLLQMIDGICSDTYNIHVIAVLNTDNPNDIDRTLFDCNNLIDVIEIDRLNKEKIQYLCKHLGRKNKFLDETRLIDVLNNKKIKDEDSDMGF